MTFEIFENLFTLLYTVVGLLFCLFKYIEIPKRGYLYLVCFFLAYFFSDYYVAIYLLTTHSYSTLSKFIAYIGWNISYVFLFLAVFHLTEDKKETKRYFHPLMLLPAMTNIPLLIFFIRSGSILNDLWRVGITTLIMIFCLRELLLYYKHKKNDRKHFPRLLSLILLFTISEYGRWTSSYFGWKSELSNPYLYFTIIGSLSMVFFAWSTEKDYEAKDQIVINKKNEAEFRFQTFLQTIASFVILGGCACGYFSALWLTKAVSNTEGKLEDNIAILLLIITIVVILLVTIILQVIASRYMSGEGKQREMDAESLSRINFIFTVFTTIALMAFVSLYNLKLLYDSSVVGIYEDGDNKVKMFSTDLENYLTIAETTLRIVADTVDLMEKNGASSQDVLQYISAQTKKQSEQFDENFTGIYACISGEYMDGSGWVPPAGYNPLSRDWYKSAVKAGGEIVIVSPYIDAQTGYIVITIAKGISNGNMSEDKPTSNVVCLDVILNHVKEATEQIDIAGKGYAMVINEDGFIVSHHDETCNGKNVTDIYGTEFLNKIATIKNGTFDFMINDKESTLFVHPIMNQWYAVIAVTDIELFEAVNSQLAVNVLVSLIAFSLISFFYYLGYKNERDYSKKVEEMNLQVVSALASAIDAKDTYTNGHSVRVAEYSKMIASRLGYSNSKQDEIYMMGLLHDVGKIGILDKIINKTGKLTEEEFEVIKKHPIIGSSILERIKEKPGLSIGARWHHEKFGGGGYPDGIAGEEIPEEARIIAVADAYDAMTSNRSYRGIMSQEKVRAEIEKGMGKQFDPKFAKVMLQMIDEDTDYSLCAR